MKLGREGWGGHRGVYRKLWLHTALSRASRDTSLGIMLFLTQICGKLNTRVRFQLPISLSHAAFLSDTGCSLGSMSRALGPFGGHYSNCRLAGERWKRCKVRSPPRVKRAGGVGLAWGGRGGEAAPRAQKLMTHPLVRLQTAGRGERGSCWGFTRLLWLVNRPGSCCKNRCNLLLGDFSEPSASAGLSEGKSGKYLPPEHAIIGRACLCVHQREGAAHHISAVGSFVNDGRWKYLCIKQDIQCCMSCCSR